MCVFYERKSSDRKIKHCIALDMSNGCTITDSYNVSHDRIRTDARCCQSVACRPPLIRL